MPDNLVKSTHQSLELAEYIVPVKQILKKYLTIMSNKCIVQLRRNYYKLKKNIMNKLLDYLATGLIFLGCVGVIALGMLNLPKVTSDVGTHISFIVVGMGFMVHLHQIYRTSQKDDIIRYIAILLMILVVTIFMLCPVLEMIAILLSIKLLETISFYLLLAALGIVALGGLVPYIVWECRKE